MNQLYLGILVHDMHNPLSNIKMGWEYFNQTKEELSLSPKHEQFMAAMEIGIWEIKNMIHNIISVSKFEQGHASATHSTFNLKDAILENLKNFEALTSLTKKSIHFSFGLKDDFELHSDPEFLKQVLLNLVGNSLRYCPENEAIEIEIQPHEENEIKISVTNPGSFIEQSMRTQVFEKYFNGNFATPYQGNKNYGLGLTYSRLAVEALGGLIWIDSSESPPITTFHFTVKNQT